MQISSSGILLIDKLKGITSFDVIRILRKKLGKKKMGHAGTLDPLASGLMIIGIDKGTKKLNDFLKLPKVYEAEVLLGIQTTTGDMEGKIIAQKNVETVSMDDTNKVLENMVGKIILPVPIYSAIKIASKPLYKYARTNLAVRPPSKEMEIFWIKLINSSLCTNPKNSLIISIELEVASGTYIRSIAEEIGRRLGYPATTKNLRRTKIGDFKIEDAQVL
ncbi:MAG: tRNA pseudouridine(55) synthase TruB [Patescibacteria group bacterium]